MAAFFRSVWQFAVEFLYVAIGRWSIKGRLLQIATVVAVAALSFKEDQKVELTLGAAISLAAVGLYLAAVAGYALAKSRWAVLRIGDEMTPGADGAAYFLKVFNDGFGVAEVQVFVTEVLDEAGRSVDAGLPRECFPDPDKPAPIRVSREVPASVRVLRHHFIRQGDAREHHFAIAAGEDRFCPILKVAEAPATRRVKVTVRCGAYSEGKWFTVQGRANSALFRCVADRPPAPWRFGWHREESAVTS